MQTKSLTDLASQITNAPLPLPLEVTAEVHTMTKAELKRHEERGRERAAAEGRLRDAAKVTAALPISQDEKDAIRAKQDAVISKIRAADGKAGFPIPGPLVGKPKGAKGGAQVTKCPTAVAKGAYPTKRAAAAKLPIPPRRSMKASDEAVTANMPAFAGRSIAHEQMIEDGCPPEALRENTPAAKALATKRRNEVTERKIKNPPDRARPSAAALGTAPAHLTAKKDSSTMKTAKKTSPAKAAKAARKVAKAAAKAERVAKSPRKAPPARKAATSPSGMVVEILKLSSRAKGVTPAELNEKTQWKGAPWKWLFQNPKKNGYCDRWGYSFEVIRDDAGTHYKTAKLPA